jgi:CRISPR system Cascade subunit CasD
MGEFLIFTIAAPLASFGSLAVGERRPSANRPTKSQTLGLVAAALGIERGEEAKLAALRDSLGFAVRVDEAGQPAFDYHTTQTPSAVSIKRRTKQFGPVRTRAHELQCDELKTILSTREYRTGAIVSPALWLRTNDAPVSLQTMRDALLQPRFPLFVGRKSHPLMLPCAPCTVDAEDVSAAFAIYDATPDHAVINMLKKRIGLAVTASGAVIYSDSEAVPAGQPNIRVEQRRDVPESRAKWRFGLRQETAFTPITEGGS